MKRIVSQALALGAVIVLAAACTDGDGPDDDSPNTGAHGGKSGNGGIGGKGGSSGKGGTGLTGGDAGGPGHGGTAGQGGDVAQGGSSAHGGTAGASGTAGEGGTAGGGNECPTDFTAADGKPCTPEGKHCSSGNGDPCGFGQFLTCTNGVWVHQEAFPDPNCGAGAGGQSGGGGQAGAGESSGGSAGETGGAGAGGA